MPGDNTENEEELPLINYDDFEFYKSRYIEVLNQHRGRINNCASNQQTTDLQTDFTTRINDLRNEIVNNMNGHNTRINELVEAINRINERIVENHNKLWERCNEVQRYANGLQEQINELRRKI